MDQQIAGYLIIYRVADGRAWNESNMRSTLPPMRFNDRDESKQSERIENGKFITARVGTLSSNSFLSHSQVEREREKLLNEVSGDEIRNL